MDEDYRLKGLITVKDIQKKLEVPECLQGCAGPPARGRGASASRAITIERAEALVAADVDVLVVDTAHGHCAAA